MKELDAIIAEQALLLMWNGYHEKNLCNGEAEGSYREHLKIAVQELLDRGDLLIEPEPFEVKLFGHFNHGKDQVLFTFSYEYDGLLSQINLKQVEARLNGIPLTIAIDKGSDLWPSQEMYERVRSLSTTINHVLDSERAAELKKMVGYELALLHKNGYTGEKLETHLTSIIQKAESTPDKEHHFRITGRLKVGQEQEAFHYKLFYRYHPTSSNLRLKEVNARIGNTAETFLSTQSYPVPPVKDIYQYLLNKRKTQTVERLIRHQRVADNSQKHRKK